MDIIISGSTGRMGRILAETIAGRPEAYRVAASYAPGADVSVAHTYRNLDAITGQADVIIDFSSHLATAALCGFARRRKLPLVVCTTGQSEEEKTAIRELSRELPVFLSGNMSLGIATLVDLVRSAVRLFPEADVEIVEKHHNQKLDVPSGTALMLAHAVQAVRPDSFLDIGRPKSGKRDPREIGIHSLRMGNEVGTHEVYINTGSECLILSHQAESRAVFAEGALKAASFLVGRGPGLYTMKELLEA